MERFRNFYEEPEVEIKKFGTDDIMLTSFGMETDPDDNDVDDPWG